MTRTKRIMIGSLVVLAACLDGLEPSIGPANPLAPAWVAVLVGDSAPVRLVAASGDTLTGDDVQWSSSRPDIAEVTSSGYVQGRSYGQALIRGSAQGTTAFATVVVAPPVLVGAGTIGECASTGPQATSALLDQTPGVVFTAGDNAYPNGTELDYAYCYDPSWGRHRGRTRPTPGNHDYNTTGAAGYFNYFGPNAGEPTKGYYSYDFAGWHLIALNTQIALHAGSAQEVWLREDLEASSTACTLAYAHYQRFGSGPAGGNSQLRVLWEALYSAGVDVMISGNDHHYERFAPQNPDGVLDHVAGMRQFIVGTGGGTLVPVDTATANSEIRIPNTFGVLKLTLDSTTYSWQFLRAPGGAVLDSGTTACH